MFTGLTLSHTLAIHPRVGNLTDVSVTIIIMNAAERGHSVMEKYPTGGNVSAVCTMTARMMEH